GDRVSRPGQLDHLPGLKLDPDAMIHHAGHGRGELALLPEATHVRFVGADVDQVAQLWLQRRKDLRTLLEEPNEHAGSGGVSRGVRERPAQEELAGSDLTGTLRADLRLLAVERIPGHHRAQ